MVDFYCNLVVVIVFTELIITITILCLLPSARMYHISFSRPEPHRPTTNNERRDPTPAHAPKHRSTSRLSPVQCVTGPPKSPQHSLLHINCVTFATDRTG